MHEESWSFSPCRCVSLSDVVRRWGLIQSQALEKDYRLQQRRHQWTQFKTDLRSLLGWLDEAEAVQVRQTDVPTDIKQLEMAVRRQRVSETTVHKLGRSSLCDRVQQILQYNMYSPAVEKVFSV